MRDGLTDEGDPLQARKDLAGQLDRGPHRGVGGGEGVVGRVILRSRPVTGPLEPDDPRGGREPLPVGEHEVAGHLARGHDHVERPIPVFCHEPPGGPLGIVGGAIEAGEVEVFDEHIAASRACGQSGPEAVHELHERRAGRPFLVDHEHPLCGQGRCGRRRSR